MQYNVENVWISKKISKVQENFHNFFFLTWPILQMTKWVLFLKHVKFIKHLLIFNKYKTSCLNFRRRLFFLELFPGRFDSFGRGGNRRNRPQFRLVFRSFGKNRRERRFPGRGRLRSTLTQQTPGRHPGKKIVSMSVAFTTVMLKCSW